MGSATRWAPAHALHGRALRANLRVVVRVRRARARVERQRLLILLLGQGDVALGGGWMCVRCVCAVGSACKGGTVHAATPTRRIPPPRTWLTYTSGSFMKPSLLAAACCTSANASLRGRGAGRGRRPRRERNGGSRRHTPPRHEAALCEV